MSYLFHIRNIHTGLWLVAPVTNWKDTCKPEWTDIREAAYRFSPMAAADQVRYLWWNVSIRAKSARVPPPFIKPISPEILVITAG